MQKNGISRRIDELGRITIPKEMRKNLDIKDGDMLNIGLGADGIVLSKHTAKEKLSHAMDLLRECSESSEEFDPATVREMGELLNRISAE
jgi:AbrB family looped-hinge helix DNA binding protein